MSQKVKRVEAFPKGVMKLLFNTDCLRICQAFLKFYGEKIRELEIVLFAKTKEDGKSLGESRREFSANSDGNFS
jgi:hypothetical protein